MIYRIVIVLLILIILGLLIRSVIIKKNVKDMISELIRTREAGYDRKLKIALIDKDLEDLTSEINRNIEFQKQLKLEEENARRNIKQSVSDIAHDLRTPLTVIRGNLQMLAEEPLSENGQQYLKACDKRAENLKTMVDEFFELSLIESGDVSFSPEKIDIAGFIASFVIENESLIRSKKLVPKINMPEKTLFITVDRQMLTRVFGNLLNNVCKYAKDSFFIDILEEEGSHVTIRIGNSIKESEEIDVERIFDRTYRADKSRSDKSAGLGLYIVKLLTEKMHGRIDASIDGEKLVFAIYF